MIDASLMPIKEAIAELKRHRITPVGLDTGDIIDRAREAARQEAETARRLASIEKKIDEQKAELAEQRIEVAKRFTALEGSLKEDVGKLNKNVEEFGGRLSETIENVGKLNKNVEEASKNVEKLDKNFGQVSEALKKAAEEHRRAIDWEKDVLAELPEKSLTEEQVNTLKQVEDILRKKGWIAYGEGVRAAAEAQA